MLLSRDRSISRSARQLGLGAALLLALTGCEPPETTVEAPDYSNMPAVKGKVTVDGKPVAGVVVTFIPPSFGPSNGETKADGTYELATANRPGAPPGSYKVAISYLVGEDGTTYGLGPRSALSQPPGLSLAREKLAPEVANPGLTKLTATVSPGGSTLDFEVKTIEPVPSKAPAPTPAKDAAPAPTPAKDETKKK